MDEVQQWESAVQRVRDTDPDTPEGRDARKTLALLRKRGVEDRVHESETPGVWRMTVVFEIDLEAKCRDQARALGYMAAKEVCQNSAFTIPMCTSLKKVESV